jgi:acyl-CoA thioester hydrolase
VTIDEFAFSVPQEIVLRDLDSFGHVNNAVYLTFIENARIAYLKEVVKAVRRDEIRNIMAAVSIDFRAEVAFEDELEMGVRTDRLGTKSFQLSYRMLRSDGVVAVDATSTQVMFDFDRGVAIEVPEEWRRAISAYDGLDQ